MTFFFGVASSPRAEAPPFLQVFVYWDVWTASGAHHYPSTAHRMAHVFSHAASAMLVTSATTVFSFLLISLFLIPGCEGQLLREGQHHAPWALRRKLWYSPQLPRQHCSRRTNVSQHCAMQDEIRLNRKHLQIIYIGQRACTKKHANRYE